MGAEAEASQNYLIRQHSQYAATVPSTQSPAAARSHANLFPSIHRLQAHLDDIIIAEGLGCLPHLNFFLRVGGRLCRQPSLPHQAHKAMQGSGRDSAREP